MARVISSVSANSASRNRAVLMVAAVFGLLSFVLAFAFLNSRSGTDSISEELSKGQGAVTVLVATQDIAPGTAVTRDMFTSKTLPAAVLLPGRIESEDQVVGKVATAPILAGEQIVIERVTTYEGQKTLAFKVPTGLRALSVQIPHEAWANGGLAQPGDRVDVFATLIFTETDPLSGREKANAKAGIIAENIEVLAVSQSLLKTIPNTDARKRAADGSTAEAASAEGAAVAKPDDKVETYQEAISVTLALTPEQAAKVLQIDALRDDTAQFRLTTRQKGDEAKISGKKTWTLDDVFN